MSAALRVAVTAAVKPALLAVIADMPIESVENVQFVKPANAPWGRISFRDGPEQQVSIGTPAQWRQAIVCFVDVFVPLGEGEARVIAASKAAKDALRRLVVPGEGRWFRFDAGPEGKEESYYRKQTVAVFRRDVRV
jgi:hypothetical protein